MKRTPLQRGTTPLARTTRMAKRNAKRKGSRFPRRRDPAYCAWIRTLGCPFDRATMRFEPPTAEIGWILLHKDCGGPVECAHVKSRGAGGDDVGNTIPLCRRHHREQHDRGIQSFQDLYGLDMAGFAQRLTSRYPGEPKAPASPSASPHEGE